MPTNAANSLNFKEQLVQTRKKYLWRVMYEYALELDRAKLEPLPHQYQLVEADNTKLKAMLKEHPKSFPKRKYKIIKKRLELPSEQCLLITDLADNYYGYCHLAFADHLNTRINYRVKLEEGHFYLFDDHVFRKYRGRGLHSFSIQSRLALAKSMGYKTALTLIEQGNIPSAKAYGKHNFTITKKLIIFPLLKKTVRLP